MPRAMSLLTAMVFIAPPGLKAEADADNARLRRPVALVAQDHSIAVANRRSGTLSIVDATARQVTAEHVVADRIAHMIGIPQSQSVLVADDASNRLIRVSLEDSKPVIKAIAELPVGASRMALTTGRRELFVSGRWSRCVAVFHFEEGFERTSEVARIEMPFAPQDMLLLNDDRTLLVADAFSGQMVIVDVAAREITDRHRLPGHNIRGMATSENGRRLYVAQQKFDPLARADYEDLHWGALVTNAVRVVEIGNLGEPDESVVKGWLDEFGGIGNATGDPSEVLTGPNGLIAVALAGTREVALRHGGYATRLKVGRHPEAMVVNGDHLFVANRFDDSLSVIDLPLGKTIQTVSLGPMPKLTAADRGELLFFDADLSHDGWMSCHSCHTDGHSSGLLVDTLGDGDYGSPKRVPSLLGTRDTAPWSWTGAMPTLAEQVRKSVTTTMHGDSLTDQQVADLVAYLETLQPPPSGVTHDKSLLARGQTVFKARGCIECHAGSKLTSSGTFDVGLTDEKNRSEFNPPSLRGVGQRDRLFHDGRAAGLDEAINKVRHKLNEPLSASDSQALIAYLRSL